LREEVAFPCIVLGPVECRQGCHWWIRSAWRARRSADHLLDLVISSFM
jgi:hypothetical protein